ncbi:MAG TPA: hypothetical protein VHI13_00730 [Candidatus Kapabacteria bacterium]|nr:hypothetical protein [Candidatus Kapabacteria bacterium]
MNPEGTCFVARKHGGTTRGTIFAEWFNRHDAAAGCVPHIYRNLLVRNPEYCLAHDSCSGTAGVASQALRYAEHWFSLSPTRISAGKRAGFLFIDIHGGSQWQQSR